jgi:hypothetical protein
MTTGTSLQIGLRTKRQAVWEFVARLTGENTNEAIKNGAQTRSSDGSITRQRIRKDMRGDFVMKFNGLRAAAILIAFAFALCLSAAEVGGQAPEQITLKEAVGRAVTDLGLQKGSTKLCVLSNAPFIMDPTVTCLDMVHTVTGCSVAQKNILFYHSPITAPLRIVLFHKDTGGAGVITHHNGKSSRDRLTDPCSPIAAAGKAQHAETARISLAPDKVVDPDSYGAIAEKSGPSDAFSIASIVNAWAMGPPMTS